METEIDYKTVITQLQIENEVLKSLLGRPKMALPKVDLDLDLSWFTEMDWQERYFLAATVCAVLVTIVSIIRLLKARRDDV